MGETDRKARKNEVSVELTQTKVLTKLGAFVAILNAGIAVALPLVPFTDLRVPSTERRILCWYLRSSQLLNFGHTVFGLQVPSTR